MEAVELIATDNGSAFKAKAFTDTCCDLGMTHLRTIAGAATMRGTGERIFGTIGSNLLPLLSGRTFSDVVEKGDHPAEKRACLDAEDICRILVRWIVDIYHNTPHRGLGGRTPREQWERDHREGNYPLKAAPDKRRKRLAFGISRTMKGTKEGITVLGVRYQNEALAHSIVSGGPRHFNIRWDETDTGAIEVQIDGSWQEVRASEEGLDGVHAQVWIATRRDLRSRSPKQAAWNEDVVREAMAAIKALKQHRSLQFQLIDKPYSVEYLQKLEESLFASFAIVPTSPKLALSENGPGRVILPQGSVLDIRHEASDVEQTGPGSGGPEEHGSGWAFRG
jgi:putative transposase